MCLYDMTAEENLSRSMAGSNRSGRGGRASDRGGDLYKTVLENLCRLASVSICANRKI